MKAEFDTLLKTKLGIWCPVILTKMLFLVSGCSELSAKPMALLIDTRRV